MTALLRANSLLLAACLVGGCSATAPKDEVLPAPTTNSIGSLAQAMSLFKAERYERCANLCEVMLQKRLAARKTETLRFLEAESLYQLGDFELALAEYRRLLEDFPFTRAHAVLPDRLYAIGCGLAENPKPLLGGVLLDRKPAIEALGFLVVNYPEHHCCNDAWLRLAGQHQAGHEWAFAEEAYRRLLARRPPKEVREKALHALAVCLQCSTKGAAYDISPLIEARDVAEEYLKDFGDTPAAPEMEALVEQVAHEVEENGRIIEEFYRRRGN
ncbi:MAG: tetratricopeptide repeat protein [Planctomycetota bacterium]